MKAALRQPRTALRGTVRCIASHALFTIEVVFDKNNSTGHYISLHKKQWTLSASNRYLRHQNSIFVRAEWFLFLFFSFWKWMTDCNTIFFFFKKKSTQIIVLQKVSRKNIFTQYYLLQWQQSTGKKIGTRLRTALIRFCSITAFELYLSKNFKYKTSKI